jgi:putative transposase
MRAFAAKSSRESASPPARRRPSAPTGQPRVSYDFVFDWCSSGQQLKCLTVSNEWTKEGLAIEVDGRIRSPRVIEVLARLISERGAPLTLRSCRGRCSNGWSIGASDAR